MNAERRTIYRRLFDFQRGLCAVCGRPPAKGTLAMDHDPETRAVRGLLCSRCSAVLEATLGDVDTLKKFIEYLEVYKMLPSPLIDLHARTQGEWDRLRGRYEKLIPKKTRPEFSRREV